MFITPGGIGAVSFDVALNGAVSNVGTASATVYRNGVVTAVVPSIDNNTSGHYSVTFNVPINWVEYDVSEVRFSLDYAGNELACTKPSGVVTSISNTISDIHKLLTADQVKVGDKIYYYEAGTGQTVLLLEQDLAGTSACNSDVSITS